MRDEMKVKVMGLHCESKLKVTARLQKFEMKVNAIDWQVDIRSRLWLQKGEMKVRVTDNGILTDEIKVIDK